MLHRFPGAAALLITMSVLAACSGRDTASEPGKTDSSAAVTDTTASSVQGVEIVSEQGGFRVRMPVGFSNPSEGRQPLIAGSDTSWMISYTAVRDTATAFIVTYTQVQQTAQVDPAQVFDMAREATLRNINGTLERQESRTLQGHAGRSMYYTGMLDSVKYYGRADLYLAMPRLYQIYYISREPGGTTSPAVNAAFASFRMRDSAVTAPDTTAPAPAPTTP